jgi:hypothetical protein
MALSGAKSKTCLGFLTVVEDPDYGLFGGYLVLNFAGRPEEFHCTAPIRPNRAQQILYGPTLEPYLFGEQIGQALLTKSKARPVLVCTDREAALAVREHVDVPVALVLPSEAPAPSTSEQPASGTSWRIDPAHATPQLVSFRLGRNCLAVSAEDQQQIGTQLAALADSFDLTEPFGRIREAIEEARRGGQ